MSLSPKFSLRNEAIDLNLNLDLNRIEKLHELSTMFYDALFKARDAKADGNLISLASIAYEYTKEADKLRQVDIEDLRKDVIRLREERMRHEGMINRNHQAIGRLEEEVKGLREQLANQKPGTISQNELSFDQFSRMLNSGEILEFSKVGERIPGSANTKHLVVTKDGRTMYVILRYDPITNQIYPPQ